MTQRRTDSRNRWRNKVVSFRMSPQEADLLDMFVKISGLSKQDYITSRVLQRRITVNGNPRTYKALKDLLTQVLYELRRLEAVTPDNDELILLTDRPPCMGLKTSDIPASRPFTPRSFWKRACCRVCRARLPLS